MDRDKILQAIDACRSGSDDLDAAELAAVKQQIEADPQLRRMQQRAEQWDHAIGDAMVGVPVPGGLEQRLLSRLKTDAEQGAADLTGDGDLAPVSSNEDGLVVPAERPRPQRARLRLWNTAGITAVTALVIALTVYLVRPHTGQDWSAELLAVQALVRFQSFDSQEGLETGPSPKDFPLSASLAARADGWRLVRDWFGGSGVTYHLTVGGNSQGWLFVLDAPPALLAALPSDPPRNLDHQTAGRGCAVWQENGKLCVLIIKGDERTFDRFIKPRRMA